MTDQSGKSNRPVNEMSAGERAEFRRRLSELDEKLDDAQGRRSVEKDQSGRGKVVGYGLRMATDIIAAVLVGGGIGWFLDQWLGTSPYLLLIFIVLGLIAGIRNLIRTYRLMTAEFGLNTGVDMDDLSTPLKDDKDPN